MRKTLEDRFWRFVDVGGLDACWTWKGSVRANGYGQIHGRGTTLKAHRVSWELNNGPIPHGLVVCHTCDRRTCVNPRHLFVGTQADNMADASRKGRCRGKVQTGESHPAAKLTAADIPVIRALVDGGHPSTQVGRLYGVDRTTISLIARRKTWRSVPEGYGRTPEPKYDRPIGARA